MNNNLSEVLSDLILYIVIFLMGIWFSNTLHSEELKDCLPTEQQQEQALFHIQLVII